jgi:hypothetical protein
LSELKGKSIAGRMARSEIVLSEQLRTQRNTEEEAKNLRLSAYRHYTEATGKVIDSDEARKEVDFDLLIPFIDR